MIDYMIFIFFFFFQAEDGIRDRNVTGVQTCALPIFREILKRPDVRAASRALAEAAAVAVPTPYILWSDELKAILNAHIKRSEERRVGKECRSRRAAYH